VTDIHIGAPLDLVFNNENINTNASRANQINELLATAQPGNVITQPPTPNPPRLVFPPPNPNRAIFGEEPTTKSSYGPPGALVTGGPPAGCIASSLNLLVVGNPFASQIGQVGLLGTFFMGVFTGPQPPPSSPPPPPPFCPFTSRQQVGHFLYVLDRDNRQIVVVNSNRFTVLDTIQLSDPVSLAMSPNMTRLAVTNFASASVSFIDIDPTSSNFHQVVAETRVERGPTAIAWQPDGEDILVVSSDSNFLTIISAFDFAVRRSVGGFLNAPVELVVTERYQASGNASGLYYAYILNSNGTVAIYESGPDGVNGIGFNDIIGTVANVNFPRARSMSYDALASSGGVFVGHVDDSGLGQVSRLWLTSTPVGALPLNPSSGGFILPPTYRQKEWTVTQRFGGITPGTPLRDLLSGNSVIDLATDELLNFGGLLGQGTPYNLAYLRTPYFHSGKHTVKGAAGGPTIGYIPKYIFIALSDVGKVDVFEIETGTRVATVNVPGVRVVANYWRQ
jgi:DNA-binding beta-propeller fold protein YncE